MQSLETMELRPWTIVSTIASPEGPAGSCAVWRIARPSQAASAVERLPEASAEPATTTLNPGEEGELALALFSSRNRAQEYQRLIASNGVEATHAQLIQLDERQLLQVLMAGFQQGMSYAALDPGQETARQIFVLRDVLRAAQLKLRGQTGTQVN